LLGLRKTDVGKIQQIYEEKVEAIKYTVVPEFAADQVLADIRGFHIKENELKTDKTLHDQFVNLSSALEKCDNYRKCFLLL